MNTRESSEKDKFAVVEDLMSCDGVDPSTFGEYDDDDSLVPPLCTLIDEEGNEQQFEILHTLEYEGEEYYALLPYEEPTLPLEVTQKIDPNEIFVVMRLQILEDGTEAMASVDDDALYDLVGGMFLEEFALLYEQECERLDP